VAEVLAYIYQLKRYRKEGGEQPNEPHDLLVPAELDPANTESPLSLAGEG